MSGREIAFWLFFFVACIGHIEKHGLADSILIIALAVYVFAKTDLD